MHAHDAAAADALLPSSPAICAQVCGCIGVSRTRLGASGEGSCLTKPCRLYVLQTAQHLRLLACCVQVHRRDVLRGAVLGAAGKTATIPSCPACAWAYALIISITCAPLLCRFTDVMFCARLCWALPEKGDDVCTRYRRRDKS